MEVRSWELEISIAVVLQDWIKIRNKHLAMSDPTVTNMPPVLASLPNYDYDCS